MTLRPFQSQAIHFLSGTRRSGEGIHLLCIAPTGSGKSRIFEELSRTKGWRVLLITPLIALARQQAERFRALGIKVACLTGQEGSPEPDTRVWISSPEHFRSDSFRSAIHAFKPQLIVVDEAHCVCSWGRRFRPEYGELPERVRAFSGQRTLWLTATPPRGLEDRLRRTLGEGFAVQGSFELPDGLRLAFAQVEGAERLELFLNWNALLIKEPRFVFAFTRKLAERLALAAGSALVYHAGLSPEERRGLEARIRTGKPELIIATSAFGMGMDYSHLQQALLWEPPESLLSLTQLLGRVGRGRGGGRALALWSYEDFSRLRNWLGKTEAERQEIDACRDFYTSRSCRRQSLRSYFASGRGDFADGAACGLCDCCAPEDFLEGSLFAGARAASDSNWISKSEASSVQMPSTRTPRGSVLKHDLKLRLTGMRGV